MKSFLNISKPQTTNFSLLKKLYVVVVFFLTAVSLGWGAEPIEWKGSTSSEWNDGSNWDGGNTPDTEADVKIPSGCTYYPILTHNQDVGGIEIDGGTLTISTEGRITDNKSGGIIIYSGGTLTIENGGILNRTADLDLKAGGTLTVTSGSIDCKDILIRGTANISGSSTKLLGNKSGGISVFNGGIFSLADGEIAKYGDIYVYSGGEFSVSNGTIDLKLNNYYKIENSGTVNFDSVYLYDKYIEQGSCTTNISGSSYFAGTVTFISSSTVSIGSSSSVFFVNPEESGDNASDKNIITIPKDMTFEKLYVSGEVQVDIKNDSTVTCSSFGLWTEISEFVSTYNYESIISGGVLTCTGSTKLLRGTSDNDESSAVIGSLRINSEFNCENGDFKYNVGTNVSFAQETKLKSLLRYDNNFITPKTSVVIESTVDVSDSVVLGYSGKTGSSELSVSNGGNLYTPLLQFLCSTYSNENSLYPLIIESGGQIGDSTNPTGNININTSDISNNGTIYIGGTSAALTCGEIVDGGSGTINSSESTVTVSDSSSIENLNVSDITVLSGDFTIGTATLKAQTTFYGENTFETLSIDTSATESVVTIVFEKDKTQTITNSLLAKGNSESNYLLFDSDDSSTKWILDIPSVSSDNFEYVKVSNSSSVNFLNLRKNSAKISEGTNTDNWFLVQYTWLGTTSSSWNTTSNWDVDEVPVAGSKVIIATTGSYNPVLSASDTIGVTLELLTVNSGSSLDCAGQSVSASTITNDGTIRLTGNEILTVTTKNNESGTVEYYGDSTTLANWGTDYFNLLVTGVSDFGLTNFTIEGDATFDAASTFGGNISVGGNLSVASACSFSGTTVVEGDLSITSGCSFTEEFQVTGETTINTTEDVTFSNSDNVFTGTIDVTECGDLKINALTFGSFINIINAKDVSITSASTVEYGDNESTDVGKLNVTSADDVTYKNTSTGFLILGKIEQANSFTAIANKTIRITDDINTTENQVFDGPTVCGNNDVDTFTQTGKIITFNSTLKLKHHLIINANTETNLNGKISENKNFSITGTGTTYLNADIDSIRNLTIDSPLVIGSTCNKINTSQASGVQTYNNTVTVDSDCTFLAAGSSITFASAVTAIGKTLTFGSSTDSKTVTFKSDVTCGGLTNNYKTIFTNGTSTPITVTGEGTFNNTINVGVKTIFASDCVFKDVTATAETVFDGENVFETFTSTADATFNADNEFGTFTAQTRDTTYTFAKKKTQSVGVFNVTGEEEHLITLKSDSSTLSGTANQWIINYTGTTADVDTNVVVNYVRLQNSCNSTLDASSNHLYLTANDSKDCGNNTYWYMPGNAYIWVGRTDTSWNTTSNWENYSIPGYMVDVTIGESSNSYYPILSSTDKIQYELAEITVENNASLNVGGQTITAEAIINEGSIDVAGGKIILSGISPNFTNSGTVRLKGAENLTIQIDNDTGTVEYYGGTVGSPTTNASWGSNYYNLLVTGVSDFGTTNFTIAGNATINAATTFSGNTVVTGTTTINTTGDVTFNGSNNAFTGQVSATNCGAFSISSGAALSLGAVTASSLTVTNTDIINLKGNVTTTEAQDYTGIVNIPSSAITLNGTNLRFRNPVNYSQNLTIVGSSAIQFDSTLTYSSNAALELNGTATINCSGAVTTGRITSSLTGVGAYTGSVTINGESTFANENTFGTFTANAVVNFNGVNTFADFTSTASATFNDDNTFTKFTATTAGTTYTFKSDTSQSFTELTVTGGSGDSNLIKLQSETSGSQWNIKYNGAEDNLATNVSVSYTKITDSNNITTKSTSLPLYLVASNSKDGGNNVNWSFPGETYTWTGGASSTSWNTKANWSPASVPGNDTNVVIANAADQPVLTSSDGIDSFNYESITINSEATLDCSDQVVISEMITNQGTVRLKGISANVIKKLNGDLPSITNDNNSSVEYYGGTVGSPTTNATWGSNYYNLLVTGVSDFGSTNFTIAGNATINAATTFSGNTVVTGTTTMNTTGDVTFNATANIFTGDISVTNCGTLVLNADEIHSNITVLQSGNISSQINTLGSSSEVKLSNAGDTTFTITGSDIKFTGVINVNSLTVKNLSYNIILAEDVTTTNDQLFNGSVTVPTKAIVMTSSNSTIQFNRALSNSQELTLNSPVVFGDDQSILVTANASQTYNDTVTVNKSLTLTTATDSVLTFEKSIASYPTGTYDLTINNNGLLRIKNNDSTVVNVKNFTQSGEGGVQIAGEFIAYGKIKFESDVYVDGETSFTCGSSYSTEFEKNFFINASGKNCKFNSDTEIGKNFVLLNGNASLADGINFTASEDILLLNGSASTMNNDTDSGVQDLYSYFNSNRTTAVGKTASPSLTALPVQMPDGTVISDDSFTGSFTGSTGAQNSLNGQTITAKKNFYANGVHLTGSAPWTLKLKSNDKATDAFAELYNSSISYCNASTFESESGKVAYLAAASGTTGNTAEGNTDEGNNTGVYFSRPEVKIAYTIYDDVVFVSFKDSISGADIKIENSDNEISAASENIKNNACAYSTWVDSACTVSTDGAGDLSSFYLKSESTWKTDAIGTSAGDEQSTDMGRGTGTTDASGAVQPSKDRTTIPYIDVPKATDSVFATLRDEHKNRIAHSTGSNRITDVQDRCPPVLIGVRIGQELHRSPSSNQQDFDSHNFIEYLYSEKITVEGLDLSETNLQSTVSLGGITNNSGEDSGFTVAGLSAFERGKVETFVQGTADTVTVHSLYRKFAQTAENAFNCTFTEQTHRVRVGICSYVDSDVTVGGTNYKHWKGYIDGATYPQGTVTRLENAGIKDVSSADAGVNVLCVANPDAAHVLPVITVNVENTELYGSWDTKSPGFAAYISYDGVNTDDASELFGVHEDGITVLNAIEFHIWDNDYDFSSSSTEENFWYTQIGWQNTSRDYTTSNSYAADIFGGSRAFDEDTQRRTSGGVRYSSLYNCSSNFTYATGVKQSHTGKNFADKNITPGATSTKFYPADASASYNSTGSYDGLYFSIAFEANTNHSLKETFTVSYDGQGYITDLAGNVLYANTIYTTDSVDPKFEITVAKLDGDELYVVFNKKIKTENVIVTTDDYVQHKNDTAASLRFVTINDDGTYNVVSDLYVESQKKVVFSNEHFTGIIYKLSDKLNLYQLQNYYLQCYSPFIKDSVDPATGIPGVSVTYIQGYEDGANSTFMPHGEAHCISDFAVNAVEMNYAYDNRVAENTDENFMYDIYTEDSIAVHDWNEEQNNYGSLNAGYDITMQASVYSDEGIGKVEAIFDNSPDAESLSTEYNGNITDETTGESLVSNWRIWLPTELTTLAYEANKDYYKQVVEVQDDLLDFEIPYENVQNWLSGDQVSFLFKLKDSAGQDLTICRHPIFTLDENDSTGGGTYSNPKTEPLYSLRLKDESDLTTLDLWSFKLKSVSRQRGGVSIVNNVINASQGEKTVIQVDVKESSNVSVVVMTLDGDVVQYLQHGTLAAGTHSFTWNGKSKSGKLCARGLYFVRVFGAGIDETRKVMLVKD